MRHLTLPAFLVAFLAIWLLYFLGVAVLPARSIYVRVSEAVLLQLDFVLVTAISAFATWVLSGSRSADVARFLPLAPKQTRALRLAAHTGLILGAAGIGALVIDKVFIQNVPYLQGLAAARTAWVQDNAEREAISSAFSAVGYAFSTCFVISLCIGLLHSHVVPLKERAIVWVVSTILALASSFLVGGRSLLLVLFALLIGLVALRAHLGSKRLPRLSAKAVFAAVGMCVAVVGYALFIFVDRAALNSVDAHEYALEMLEYLGAEPMPAFERLESDSLLAQFLGVSTVALAYLVHSVYTFAAIVASPPEDVMLLFGHLRALGAKLYAAPRPDLDWSLLGRFPSLPGALYFDGGSFLLVSGASVLGILMALSVRLCQRYPASLVALGIWAAVHTTALLSPLLLAADLLHFPFVIAEFFLIAVFVRLALVLRRTVQTVLKARHPSVLPS